MSDQYLDELASQLRGFAKQRDWEQFHSPKNLAMALVVEAAELVEHFQWLTEEQSSQLEANKLDEVKEELADVFIYLVRISDQLGVDLKAAVQNKILVNQEKYPADKVKGSAKKYSEY